MASSRESLESVDGDVSQKPENKEKKKRFQPLKAMRKLFSRKKSKDESASNKSKSTSELLKVERSGTNERLTVPLDANVRSFSEENVFTHDRRQSEFGNIHKEIARSMEHINQKQYTSKLFGRIKKQRRRHSDFPCHPFPEPEYTPLMTCPAIYVEHVDTDNVIQQKPLSHSSEDSLGGMDSSENEEFNFVVSPALGFYDGWTSTPKPTESVPEGNMNLDVVSSNTSLNVSAAKHRISLQKARRASSKHRKTGAGIRSKSPLAKVEERQSNIDKSPEKSKDELLSPLSSSPHSEGEDNLKAAERNDSKEVRFTVSANETESKEEKDDSTAAGGVVLRKKRESAEQDVTKRRTISESGPGDNLSSVFEERAKRASSYESRNWESLKDEEVKVKDNEGQGQENVSELAATFNKVRRVSSKRKDDSKGNTESVSKSGERKMSTESNSIVYSAVSPTKAPPVGSSHKQLESKKSGDGGAIKKESSEGTGKTIEIKKLTMPGAFKKEESTAATKPAILSPKPTFVLNVGAKDEGPDAYKKTTPAAQKPKWRSKTLPESGDSLSPEKAEITEFGKIKRASSQHIEKQSPTVSPTKPQQPSAFGKKKEESEEAASEGKNVPEWVRLVRARKSQEDDESTPASDNANVRKADKAPQNTDNKVAEKPVTLRFKESSWNSSTQKKTSRTVTTPTSSSSSTQRSIYISKDDTEQSPSLRKLQEKLEKPNPDKGTDLSLNCGGDMSSKRHSKVQDMIKNYQNLQVT